MNDYRYIFEKYNNKGSRYTCPSCLKPNVFVRYIDTVTGEHIPSEFGKCERLNNCGYFNDPYKNGYSKKIWLQERNLDNGKMCEPSKPVPPPKPVPKPVFIPSEIFKGSLANYDDNTFVTYLKQLVGESRATKLVERFYIGTSAYWRGATIFWLMNEQMKIGGGQVVLFDKDGHTSKATLPNGDRIRRTNWIHKALIKRYEDQSTAIPKWLDTYRCYSPKFPYLFGLHQLKRNAGNKPIALVESPKAAIIATAYLPKFVWMATGSLSYLTEERLLPLKGKNIVLFPDNNGFDSWSEKAKQFSNIGNILVSDMLEKEGIIKGSDIADYLTAHSIDKFTTQTKPNSIPNGFTQFKGVRTDGVKVDVLLNEMGYPASWDSVY